MTRPFLEMIMPVPSSSDPSLFTLMLTIEGRPFCTSLGISIPPVQPVPGGLVTSLMVTCPPCVDELDEAKWPARPPTSAATSSNETRVDHRLVFFGSRGTGGCPTSKEIDDIGSRSVSGGASEASGTGGGRG